MLVLSAFTGGNEAAQTLVFGPDEHWGIGAHRIALESDEGKVEVLLQIIRETLPIAADTGQPT